MIFVSIAQQKTESPALRQAVEFSLQARPKVDGALSHYKFRELLVPDYSIEQPDTAFESIAREFTAWLKRDEVTVVVSQVKPLALNPLLRTVDSVLAMLVLTFPEVRWLFGSIRGYAKAKQGDNEEVLDRKIAIGKNLDNFRAAHGLHHLFQPVQSPLFDGPGLRDWVHGLAAKEDAEYVPRRRKLAVAIDEETDYANLHAYTAYRFGFKALAVARFDAAKALFGRECTAGFGSPKLVLEDLYLNFPDGKKGLSKLKKRQQELPGLESVTWRILVTSGHRVPGDGQRQLDNRQYVAEQKAKGRELWYLHKPHAGIFALWEDSRLAKMCLSGTQNSGKARRGTSEGFIWPPDWRQIEKDRKGQDSSGHSSPGILLLIARHLLDRAESMLGGGITSVEEAVHGAVLANDALELLGGKTPTTAAEALSLKHQFEMHAVCQFSGVKYHIAMKKRLDEIERDAESIAQWFRPREQKSTALNIRMDVVNKLVRILRAYNQFDEEQECMNRVRKLHNLLYVHERPWRFIFYPFLWYSSWLLSSFLKFSVAILFWVLGVWGVYSLVTPAGSATPKELGAFGHAIGTFFSVDPIAGYVVLSSIAVVSGLFHLSIFISLLYDMVNKK